MKKKNLYILLLLLLIAIPFTILSARQQQDNRSKAQTASFTFAAGGDYGIGGNFTNTINAISSSGVDFLFALGDLSYSGGSEQQWCSSIKSKISNVIVIAGNHDVGENSGGDINQYRTNCPFTLGTMSGDYGKQYYFDYPQSAPLARFIAISPGLKGSVNINYGNGGAGYTFTQQAIDDARSKGIKWIIVGMHKNCITAATKSCEIGEDLFKMLIDKRVDLVLQGHDHVYERSHTLKCVQINTFDVSCVADNGDDGVHNYGEGTVVVIAGTGGQSLYQLATADGEAKYFAKMQDTTYGIPKFTVTQDAIKGEFIKSGGSDFSDNFTIGNATATQPTTAQPTTAAPTLITPTIFCVGGSAEPPCATIAPTAAVQPTGGSISMAPDTSPTDSVDPSDAPSNPSPTIEPCNTDDGIASVFHNKKHKKHHGGGGGFFEQFFKFIFQFLIELLQKFGIQVPTDPSPTPDPGTPCPDPTDEPDEPTDAPQPTTQQPTTAPSAAPSIAATPTIFGTTPSAAPTGAGGGNGDPTAATCGGSANTPGAPVTGYTIAMCEDFNGTSIPSSFSPYNGGGESTVVGGGRKSSQCSVGGGMLTLAQAADGSTCGGSTNFAQKYGYWEVRMRVTSDGGSGSAPHPVLILWPDTDVWADGELDYFETDIGEGSMGVFLHCVGNPSSNCYSTNHDLDMTQWHTYGFEWTSAGFVGYVDGQQIYTTDGKGSNPSVSMHQTIQLDNLSGNTPVAPGKMEIDWMHMYKK